MEKVIERNAEIELKIERSVAAILVASKKDLVIDEIIFPKLLQSGQVLVELVSAGICGAQINEIDATKGVDKFLPHLLGHEGFCKVLDVARDVTRVRIGDKAIMHWRKSSGIDASPPEYSWNGKKLNAGWVTTFNKHAVVSENRLSKIADDCKLSSSVLPLLGCALTTAYGIVKKEIDLAYGKTVVIFGLGGIGLAILLMLKMQNPNIMVIGIDRENLKLEIAKKMGAAETIMFSSKNQCNLKLRELLGESKADIALETTGDKSCIELAYELTKENGLVNLIGVPNSNEKTSLYTLPLHYGKILKGSNGGSSVPDEDIPILIQKIESGKLSFDDYPLSSYKLSQINEAIHELRNGRPGRSIIQF